MWCFLNFSSMFSNLSLCFPCTHCELHFAWVSSYKSDLFSWAIWPQKEKEASFPLLELVQQSLALVPPPCRNTFSFSQQVPYKTVRPCPLCWCLLKFWIFHLWSPHHSAPWPLWETLYKEFGSQRVFKSSRCCPPHMLPNQSLLQAS